ncbi:MAG TPA: cytochrome c [Solirubrobacteraceae bacterium]|jgi:mono/diheme cytochrome c family protein
MAGRTKTLACLGAVALAAGGLAACGKEGIGVPKSSSLHHGAVLFNQHCGGCHTLDVAGTEGSATNVRDRERVDGPNFNVRKETVPQVLYAIRNGGFSGAIMPENIVVGPDAQAIAIFLAKYAGTKATKPKSPAG